MKRIWLIVATLSASVGIGSNQVPAAETVAIDLTQWTTPDISKVGQDPDPPPLKWSDLRYVSDIEEDGNGKEALQA